MPWRTRWIHRAALFFHMLHRKARRHARRSRSFGVLFATVSRRRGGKIKVMAEDIKHWNLFDNGARGEIKTKSPSSYLLRISMSLSSRLVARFAVDALTTAWEFFDREILFGSRFAAFTFYLELNLYFNLIKLPQETKNIFRNFIQNHLCCTTKLLKLIFRDAKNFY